LIFARIVAVSVALFQAVFTLIVWHYVCDVMNIFSCNGLVSSELGPSSSDKPSTSAGAASDTAGPSSADAPFTPRLLRPLRELDVPFIVCIIIL